MTSKAFTGLCDTDQTLMENFAPHLFSCPACGLISSDVPPKMDIYREEYLAEYQRRDGTDLGRQINAIRWGGLSRYLNGHKSLLDFGAGAGGFLRHSYRDLYPLLSIDGYDVNPKSPYHKLPEKPHPDVLTMFDVLEHMVSPKGLLEALRPKLLMVCVPSTDDLDEKVDILGWRHYKPGEHLHYYNRGSLAALFHSLEFVVEDWSYTEGARRNPDRPLDILTMVGRRR